MKKNATNEHEPTADRELDETIDETIEETFPASDAPANTVETGTHVGPPPSPGDPDNLVPGQRAGSKKDAR